MKSERTTLPLEETRMLLALISLFEPVLPVDDFVLVQVGQAFEDAAHDGGDGLDVFDAHGETRVDDVQDGACLHQLAAEVEEVFVREGDRVAEQVLVVDRHEVAELSLLRRDYHDSLQVPFGQLLDVYFLHRQTLVFVQAFHHHDSADLR